jgi:hypothetical protein
MTLLNGFRVIQADQVLSLRSVELMGLQGFVANMEVRVAQIPSLIPITSAI